MRDQAGDSGVQLGRDGPGDQVTCEVPDLCSLEQARIELVERLRSRRSALEEMILAYARGAAAEGANEDTQFLVGQAQLVSACLDLGLMAIEQSEEWSGPIPPIVVVQARRAVRNGVSLAVALHRYLTGYALAWDCVLEEVMSGETPEAYRATLLRQSWAAAASLLARVLAQAADAHIGGLRRGVQTRGQRCAELVGRLLAGAPVDVSELDYDFDQEHLGVIATGLGAEETVAILAERLDRQLLSAPQIDGSVWAWLGGRPGLSVANMERHLPADRFAEVVVAIGDPGCGRAGFRLTHRLAQAALLVAQRRRQRITRYVDVALEAHALHDPAFASSLVAAYVAPLEGERRGAVLLETLQAFYATGRNESKAAQALEVGRHTVQRRLGRVEQIIGRPLYACHAEIEVALRLAALDAPGAGGEHSLR